MILLILVFIFIALCMILKDKSRLPKNFPPGPPCLPVIGNVLSVGYDLKSAFNTWREKYGSIVGFKLGNQTSVVISDFDTLHEVFKDDRYSGRPENLQEVFSAFFGKGKEKSTGGIVFSHGDHWKEQRKFASRTLKDFGVGKSGLQTLINDEVKKLIDELQNDTGKPIDLRLRTNLAIVNTLWQVLNGEKSDLNNPKMKRVFKSTTEFIVSNSLSGPVMIMPWLRHLPYFNSKFEEARKSPQEMREITSESIQRHKESYQEDHQRDFIDCYIKKMNETEESGSSFYNETGEGNLQRTLMDLFGAGSETTATILCFAFNYLIRFPSIQQKIQEEIQLVIGSRTPLVEDRQEMPYTDAFLHEVLRHSCIVYTTPHATTEQVNLHGYTLPKGTAVYANIWWIMNDPEHWDKPEEFNPLRFMDEAGKFKKNDRFIPFLIGKRYCLGQNLAQHELFLFLTGLLQKLSFSSIYEDPEMVNINPIVGFMHQCPEFQVVMKERL